MGGSGGVGGFRRSSSAITHRIEEARQREIARLNTAVNDYLQELLAKLNARDVDLANTRLDRISAILGDVSAIEKVLLGGSVAKHTDVDGISDVDALVILNRRELQGKNPDEVKAAFFAELHDRMPRSEVSEVREGRMAVTVSFKDGMDIQLLPALVSGSRVLLASPSRKDWTEINPKRFQSLLTEANQKLGRALVPSIKLLKSMNGDLPSQKRLTGYHIEALAVDAARHYNGPAVPREVLIHLCKHAAQRVLLSIGDVTGQTRCLDEYLGPANSPQRRIVSLALSGMGRRLETAGSLAEWKALFENEG